MQELQSLFDDCRSEIESSQGDLCFELGSEHFIAPRDSEEIKVLFNLARISIENPAQVTKGDSILTSDLRKITAHELEQVLIATEKAIEIPVISLNEVKLDNAKKISRMLLNKQVGDGSELYKAHAKKVILASTARRFAGFSVDFIICLVLALGGSYLLIDTYFAELSTTANHLPKFQLETALPLISLGVAALSLTLILYPLLSMLLFKATLGSAVCRIKLNNMGYKKMSSAQILVRCLTFPLTLLSLSFMGLIFKNEALHDHLSGTHFVR